MSIEEIKIRLSNLEAGKVIKYDNALNLATQYMLDYNNDVAYLLSILEQVTPFFEMVEEGQYPGEMNALEVASKYLKAIRGN